MGSGGLLSCLFQGPEEQNRSSGGFVFFSWDKVSKASRLSKLQVSGGEKVQEVWSRKACSYRGGHLSSCRGCTSLGLMDLPRDE